MIGHLTGILLEKQPPEILLDVQGIGYEVLLPMTSFYQLPELNQQVSIYTHFVVREDAQQLYGFTDKASRSLFRELIKTNGVGPKLALAILSAMSHSDFAYAVEREEVSKLVKIPGIGKKTAERLLVELKGRLDHIATPLFFVESDNLSGGELSTNNDSTPQEEAISAMVSLGYKATEAEKMVKRIAKSGLSSEELIREALKQAF